MDTWDKSLFLKNSEEILRFFNKKDEILMIIGKGFDPRACKAIKMLNDHKIKIAKLWVIDYNENLKGSDNSGNISRSNSNLSLLNDISKNIDKDYVNMPTYKRENEKNVLIISEKVRELIVKKSIANYSNIVVDISAMPRTVSFSIIKRLIDIKNESQKLYIIVCENSDCDDKIKPVIVEGSAEYLQGFNTFSLTMQSDADDTIWLPVLGINEKEAFNIIADFLKPIEVCPIVPFPSTQVKRSEIILRDFGQILFQEREIEKRNIIYVPENYPLIVYKKLCDTAKYYEKALNNDNKRNIRYAFSSQSSKLIDIGILLTVITLNKQQIKAGVVIVENQGYALTDDYDENKDQMYCICLNDTEFNW